MRELAQLIIKSTCVQCSARFILSKVLFLKKNIIIGLVIKGQAQNIGQFYIREHRATGRPGLSIYIITLQPTCRLKVRRGIALREVDGVRALHDDALLF